ncbi:hypothetical protein [Nonomuraea typhae]|uniref:hypothetical protein n=1 Tax=Nonomuraea typhae TaxID=2603600 RepID=UPI0012FA030B|nr:hypothetical protein [Nonomuraea typhae]
MFRTGRTWRVTTPDGRRVLIHRAATRTAAIDQLLATPGPLFGDPAEALLHHLEPRPVALRPGGRLLEHRLRSRSVRGDQPPAERS